MRTAAVPTVLFGLILIVANHAGWLAATVLDTESFVETLSPPCHKTPTSHAPWARRSPTV